MASLEGKATAVLNMLKLGTKFRTMTGARIMTRTDTRTRTRNDQELGSIEKLVRAAPPLPDGATRADKMKAGAIGEEAGIAIICSMKLHHTTCVGGSFYADLHKATCMRMYENA